MAVKTKAQGSFDEEVLEDADLEARLEARESAKAEQSSAWAAYRKIDTEVKGEILKLDTQGILRCGRFRIEVKERPGRSVSFETDAKTSVSITTPESEG